MSLTLVKLVLINNGKHDAVHILVAKLASIYLTLNNIQHEVVRVSLSQWSVFVTDNLLRWMGTIHRCNASGERVSSAFKHV